MKAKNITARISERSPKYCGFTLRPIWKKLIEKLIKIIKKKDFYSSIWFPASYFKYNGMHLSSRIPILRTNDLSHFNLGWFSQPLTRVIRMQYPSSAHMIVNYPNLAKLQLKLIFWGWKTIFQMIRKVVSKCLKQLLNCQKTIQARQIICNFSRSRNNNRLFNWV